MAAAPILDFTRGRIADESAPPYDASAQPRGGHLTMLQDDVLDRIGEQLGALPLSVYVVMERRANRNGTCDPSYDTLAKATKSSRRAVIDTIKKLKDAGYVTIEQRKSEIKGHLTNVFTLPFHPNIVTLNPSERASEPVAPPSETPSERPDINDENLVHTVHPPSEFTSAGDAPKVDTSNKEKTNVFAGGDGDEPKPADKKPLPQNGPAQKLVVWWCEKVQVDEPGDYGKAVGQAAILLKRGVSTSEQANALYDYCLGQLKGGITLGGMVACLDGWKASKARPASSEKKVPHNSHKSKEPVF